MELIEGAEIFSVDEFQGFRMMCRNPACRVTFDLPHSIDTVRSCPSCREELDAKLRASVDIALKAIRLLALQGAIPEMVFVKDPSLIQRSEAPAQEAL